MGDRIEETRILSRTNPKNPLYASIGNGEKKNKGRGWLSDLVMALRRIAQGETQMFRVDRDNKKKILSDFFVSITLMALK